MPSARPERRRCLASAVDIELALGTNEQIIRPMAEKTRPGEPATEEMKRVFPVVIAYCDRIPKQLLDHDMLHEVVAKAHRQAGFARMALGRPKGREDYREAIRIYEGLAREKPDLIWLKTGLIETLYEYSNMVDTAHDQCESDAVFWRALDVAQGLIDDKRDFGKLLFDGTLGCLQRSCLVAHAPTALASRRPGDWRSGWQAWRPTGNPAARTFGLPPVSLPTATANSRRRQRPLESCEAEGELRTG